MKCKLRENSLILLLLLHGAQGLKCLFCDSETAGELCRTEPNKVEGGSVECTEDNDHCYVVKIDKWENEGQTDVWFHRGCCSVSESSFVCPLDLSEANSETRGSVQFESGHGYNKTSQRCNSHNFCNMWPYGDDENNEEEESDDLIAVLVLQGSGNHAPAFRSVNKIVGSVCLLLSLLLRPC